MLSASNISCRLGDHLLFSNVNLQINIGDRVGLVGPNGSGKTTLLRILAGELAPTSGSIALLPGETIGYLRQGFADIPHGTLADILDMASDTIFSLLGHLESANLALASSDSDVDLAAHRYQLALDAFEQRGGYQRIAEIEAWLDRFGLGDIELSRSVTTLSGGQKTRAGLAALLASRPHLLVLDEPTNHLDESGLRWLEQYLEDYSGTVLFVSHDRRFLDTLATTILAIDPDSASVREFTGNYSAYAETIQHERREAESAWHRQQVEVARIERDIRTAENKARTIERGTIDYAVRKKAAKIARPAVVRKKKLEKMLDGSNVAERPERSWGMSLDFGEAPAGADNVVTISNATIGYGDHLILRETSQIIRRGDRLAITGANGVGKTSLLSAIIGELKPLSGEIRLGPGVRIGYLSQEQSTLDPELTVLQQIGRTSAISETDLRNELHKFLFGGDTVHKVISDLSYGERSRLMLAQIVLGGATLLLLDEPMNHLDITAREAFEDALTQYRGTMVMVLHDRYSIDRLATREWRISQGELTEISGGMA